jgi:hypothetical protein
MYKIREDIMQLMYKVDNIAHMITLLFDTKQHVSKVCPICEGTGRDKNNEEAWKLGGVYQPDKICDNCGGEGKI